MIIILSVKEIAELSGVSVRTLHYYDSIDLLKPTHVNPNGYRQYTSADVEKLQKILLLKEVGLSLTDIKKVMVNRNEETQRFILEKQQEILKIRKKRMEELISSIDSLLEGENVMVFDKFSDDEIRRAFKAMMLKLSNDEVAEYIQKNGGSMEAAKKRFKESFESYEGDLKYYMGETDMEQFVKESPTKEELEKGRHTLTDLYQKLGKMVGSEIDDKVLDLIRQIHAETVLMFPVDKKDELFQEMANLYAKDEGAAQAFDSLYGIGTADYYLKCVKEFYKTKNSFLPI